ncbi:oligosaccharide flippase family protein [Apilactobacillus nanyangensis]|uniref:oligosaccharide flippase family protein n=1 Tax=Apilactobacillus nanyangensis TaxID=2799579 RepID=UPI001942DC2E|nr:polysaccharide biosynthesis C-terminal domain-containing protein [Apilactobacillus nanyangensis]
MKIIKNFLYNAAYQIFLLMVPLLTTPYLARVLGPNGVGINSYTNSIMQYFVLFGCLGTNLYANRKIAFVRDNEDELSKTFWEIFILRILMLSMSFVIFLFFVFSSNSQYEAYYVAQSITLVATMFDVSWFFMGIENFSVTVVRNFIVKIITLICIFAFVKSSSDLFLYILIISLSLLFGNLTMIPNLNKYVKKIDVKSINIKNHLLPSLLLFIPEVATQIYLVLNKTMLGIIISVQASGFYDQSDKIIKIVLAIVTATGTVMLPHVANAFINGDRSKTKEYLYDCFSIVTMISVPLFMGIASVSSKLVPLFFSSKFISVAPLLRIESIVILLIAWSNAIGVQYLLPTNQTKKYTTSVILGSIANLLLNVPFIIFFNTLGAIFATVLSELVVTIYQLYSIKKQISFKSLFKGIYKYMLSGIVMFVVTSFLNDLWPLTWGYLFMEIFVGAFVYILLTIILKANVYGIINKMKKDY